MKKTIDLPSPERQGPVRDQPPTVHERQESFRPSPDRPEPVMPTTAPATGRLGIPVGDRHDHPPADLKELGEFRTSAVSRGDADVDLRARVDAIEAELATFRRRLGMRRA